MKKHKNIFMNTNRFETFFDAILAIIITVLVLKLSQPVAPTFEAVLLINARFITYAICFLVIFIIWYDNHNLFHLVEEIDNKVLTFMPFRYLQSHFFPTLQHGWHCMWIPLQPRQCSVLIILQ